MESDSLGSTGLFYCLSGLPSVAMVQYSGVIGSEEKVEERFLVETHDGGLFVVEATPEGVKVRNLHPGNLGQIVGTAFQSDTDGEVFMLRIETHDGLIASRRIRG